MMFVFKYLLLKKYYVLWTTLYASWLYLMAIIRDPYVDDACTTQMCKKIIVSMYYLLINLKRKGGTLMWRFNYTAIL